MNEQRLDVHEGTISFWIKKGTVNYSDGQVVVLLNLSTKEGNIFLVKDSDNILRFFHIVTGKGRTDLEYDVSSLSSEEAHMFAVTWSMKSKELSLYIDGKPAAKTQIQH